MGEQIRAYGFSTGTVSLPSKGREKNTSTLDHHHRTIVNL